MAAHCQRLAEGREAIASVGQRAQIPVFQKKIEKWRGAFYRQTRRVCSGMLIKAR
jgi:hypothetical protein